MRDSYALLTHPESQVRTLIGMLDTVLKGVFPNLKSLGIVDSPYGHEGNPLIITITPDSDVPEDVPSILMPIDTAWFSYFTCLHTAMSNGLLNSFPNFSIADWRKYITVRGRRFENDRLLRWTFLTNKHRIKRLSSTGIGRWLPSIMRVDPSLSRRYLYQTSIFTEDKVHYTPETIQGILDSLSNDASRQHYSAVLNGPASTVWEQYFNDLLTNPQYMDYVTLDSDSVVLNFGIASGCELPLFLASNVSRIYNIDPSGERLFTNYVKTWTDHETSKLIAVNRILHDQDTEVEVSGDEFDVWDASKSVDAQTTTVKASTLETMIDDYAITKIDLIKADIEGAEGILVAQLGPIVERFRPQLAICLYHSIEDYVDLPQELVRICPDYDFYVKHYGPELYETVMYCIPKEKTSQSN
jgi:FkbM family methyltransferase